MDEDAFAKLEQPDRDISKEERQELRRRWLWSPWRILPSLVVAYVITVIYLWAVDTPDAWLRAVGPVLAVATYLIMRPVFSRWWFAREKRKIKDRQRAGGE